MADKYCIASGSYKDTSIWSTERDGEGGAGVPSISDNVYFTKDVTVTDFTNVLSFNRVFTIEPGVHAVWECTDTTGLHFARSSVVDVQSQARLDFISPPAVVFSGKATLRIAIGAEVHVLSEPALYTFHENAQLDNAGLFDTGSSPIVFDTTNATNDQNFGNTAGVTTNKIGANAVDRYFRSFGNGANFRTLTFGRTVEEGTPNYPQYIFLGSPTEIAEKLSFENPLDDIVHHIEQSSSLAILGDVESGTGPVDWIVGESAVSTFGGSADQVINMPSGVNGRWTVDKALGTLDLKRFSGYLQGRVRNLIVRAGSSIDLSGVSPSLPTSDSESAVYAGLAAGVPDEVDFDRDFEAFLQAAMNSCENFGSIVIPAGKSICTLSMMNHEDAEISGEGTVYVRRGELANEGRIASETKVVFLDYPLRSSFSCDNIVTAGTEFAVDCSESLGVRFHMDWNDGTFSETNTPGILTHRYVASTYDISRMLKWTATSEDGRTETTTKTIRVAASSPPSVPQVTVHIEIGENARYFGIPRCELPAVYRYTLAQGESYMHDTLQLFCPMNQAGRAVENGSVLFLARITHSNGFPVAPSEITSAEYTIYRLDDSDGSVRTPIEGHTAVSLSVGDVLLANLITDENWTFDVSGYNFRCSLDDSSYPPFPTAGRNYLVAFTLTPLDSAPRLQIQYRVHVV